MGLFMGTALLFLFLYSAPQLRTNLEKKKNHGAPIPWHASITCKRYFHTINSSKCFAPKNRGCAVLKEVKHDVPLL